MILYIMLKCNFFKDMMVILEGRMLCMHVLVSVSVRVCVHACVYVCVISLPDKIKLTSVVDIADV